MMHLLHALPKIASALLQGTLLAAVLALQILSPTLTCAAHPVESPVVSHHHRGELVQHAHVAAVPPNAPVQIPGLPACTVGPADPSALLMIAVADSYAEPQAGQILTWASHLPVAGSGAHATAGRFLPVPAPPPRTAV